MAVGSGSTGIGRAQVLLLEPPAADEGVPGVPTRAGADCFVVGRFTGCSLATDIGVWLKAGVLTPQPDACLVGGAIRVAGAFSVTSGVSISQEVRRAGTLGTMVNSLAVGVFPAHSLAASSLASVGDPVTLLGLAALIVCVAFVSATLKRVSDVGVLAPTDWSVVRSHLINRSLSFE